MAIVEPELRTLGRDAALEAPFPWLLSRGNHDFTVVLVVRHQEVPKRAQYPAGIFLFALLRLKRESRPRLLGTQLPPHFSEQLEELTKAFQCSAKCQVSVSCWQASPKGTVFYCHHLPSFFFLLFSGEKALRSVLHHSLIITPLPAAACSP